VLPTERSTPSGSLWDKTILLYGPPKIGKSTLVSEFGDVLFADTEGGLGELAVFKVGVTGWLDFLDFCAAAVENRKTHPMVAIDTLGRLGLYCSEYTNKRLGISHESDADYGKGWHVRRGEMERALAKLAATPDLGVILIAHAQDVEIKQRNRTITKTVPELDTGTRRVALGLADLILYVD
jgi:hypothetical protein